MSQYLQSLFFCKSACRRSVAASADNVHDLGAGGVAATALSSAALSACGRLGGSCVPGLFPVAFVGLFGGLEALPFHYPQLCLDIKQWAIKLGDPECPARRGTATTSPTPAGRARLRGRRKRGDEPAANYGLTVIEERSPQAVGNFFGWGTWIRTKTSGVRVRCSTIKLFPKLHGRSKPHVKSAPGECGSFCAAASP